MYREFDDLSTEKKTILRWLHCILSLVSLQTETATTNIASKKRLSPQDVLNACWESDNEESDPEIDSGNFLNDDSSEEINLPQLINNFDEEQALFRDSVSLLQTSPLPTTAD